MRTAETELAGRHFLSHVHDQLAVALVEAAQQAAQFGQKTCFLAGSTPGDLRSGAALGEVRQFGWFFPVVEKLIEWNLESAGHFLEGFDGRNRVAIFNPGDVTAKKAGALFDVPLRQFFFFAQSAKTVADNHGRIFT